MQLVSECFSSFIVRTLPSNIIVSTVEVLFELVKQTVLDAQKHMSSQRSEEFKSQEKTEVPKLQEKGSKSKEKVSKVKEKSGIEKKKSSFLLSKIKALTSKKSK